MLDGGLNVAVSPFELIAIKRNFAGRILKFAGVQFVVGPVGAMQGKMAVRGSQGLRLPRFNV